jgi:GAF domain-containing protein
VSDEIRPTVRQARGTHGQAPDAGLARKLSEIARELQAEPSTESLLQRIVEVAVTEIAPAEHAGISEIRGKRVVTRAATSDTVREVDRLQYDSGEGPCLTSLRDEITVRSDDLSVERRWPAFSAGAVALGVKSILSVQLFVDRDNLGALNLYASRPYAFADTDESTALLLASHAAIAMHSSKVETNLREAIATRDVIGQAKGVLMERMKIDQNRAFELLILTSQRTHRKLRDVAEEVAETGALPST